MTTQRGISFYFLLFVACSLLAVLFVSPVQAQQYSYKLYTVDDGLPTNAVYGGLQDSRGYIWFYTEKGISRFDGYGFRNFTVKDGLPTNDVFMLSEDAQGRLWPHTFGRRQVRIEGDSIRTIAEDREPRFHGFSVFQDGQQVWFKDNNQRLLITTSSNGFDTIPYTIHMFLNRKRPIGNGVYSYKWNTFVHITPESDTCQLLTSEGIVLDAFSLQGMTPVLAKKLVSRVHNSFFTFRNGLFIQPFSDSILYHLDLEKNRVNTFNLVDLFGKKPDFIRYYEQDGQLQVQSNLGVFILNSSLRIVDVFKAGLPANIRLDRIFKDREGNYWITSKQKGVFFLTAEERNASVAINAHQAEDNSINCLACDGQGRIYAGTRQGSVYRLTDEGVLELLLSTPPSRYNDVVEVKAMVFDGDGGLWIARQSIGLERYCLATNRLTPFLEMIAPAVVHYGPHEALFKLNFDKENLALYVKGLAWNAATEQLAVGRANYPFLYSVDEVGVPRIELLSSQRTQAVAFGPEGEVWMGHQDGLGSYRQGSYHLFENHPTLIHCNIWDLDTDENGIVWIGTDGHGLFALDGEQAVSIRGTENDIIQDLFINPGGQVWIATNRGVKGIAVDTVLQNSRVMRVLTTNSGLATDEANAIHLDDRFIYVGTNEGLTIVHREPLFQDTTPPLLIMDKVLVSGRAVPQKRRYTLSHHQNELEFFFTALSYKSFGRLRYKYQLEGADRTFQYTENRRIRYTGLKPGTYRLHISAIDIKGVESLSAPPLAVVTIRPPWWQTRLALLCWILLAGGAIWGIYRWRVYTIRRKAAADTAINKRFAELELQALQSQMNPHFIFNSLGAIQYFIQSNNKKQADLYLSKFAYLMRLFLESSKNKYLSLAEEVELIKSYVELEQLRFKSKFDFELQIDKQIDLYSEVLPTMLLQPFVENAVNHGLFHKEGQGKLQLSINKTINGRLKFVIEDDGIGRQRAMELRRQSNKNYISRALQITQERLQTLQEVEGYRITMAIEDLSDDSGRATGTRVCIEIPEME